MRQSLKNLWYALGSNLLMLIVSMLTNLIIPKVIGISEFSYWQLYVLYVGYAGIFHFGWIDGIYLRIAGKKWDENLKKYLNFQFFLYLIMEIAICVFFLILLGVSKLEVNTKIVLIYSSIGMILYNCLSFYQLIFQAVNNIKEYSRTIKIDRLVFMSLIVLFLFFGNKNYTTLIGIDMISKLVVLLYLLVRSNKEKLVFRFDEFKYSVIEGFTNIKAGISLLLSNLASTMVIGFSKWFAQFNWNLLVFGKVSFYLSILNLGIVFINSISIVFFPMIKNENKENYSNMYKKYVIIISTFLYLSLLCIYPLKYLIELWLPQYRASFIFLEILFPIIFLEGKNSLILIPFLNSLRREKIVLGATLLALLSSLLFGVFATYFIKDIRLLLFVSVLSVSCKNMFLSIKLLTFLNLNSKKNIYIENFAMFMYSIFFMMNLYYINLYILVIVFLLCLKMVKYYKKYLINKKF